MILLPLFAIYHTHTTHYFTFILYLNILNAVKMLLLTLLRQERCLTSIKVCVLCRKECHVSDFSIIYIYIDQEVVCRSFHITILLMAGHSHHLTNSD